MGKILLGIIIGAAAASAVFVSLDLRKPAASPATAVVSVQSVGVEASNASDLSVPIEATDPSIEDFAEIEAISPSARNVDERLAAQMQLVDGAQAELIELYKSNVVAELGPVVTPYPLSPEFDWLGVNLFHERMQRETIDPLWAGSTEAQLWDYIGSQPHIAERYGTPTIRCHSVRCELTWMSFDSSETKTVVQSDFRALRDGIGERLPGAFDCGLCPIELNVQDGVTTVVWGLTGPEE